MRQQYDDVSTTWNLCGDGLKLSVGPLRRTTVCGRITTVGTKLKDSKRPGCAGLAKKAFQKSCFQMGEGHHTCMMNMRLKLPVACYLILAKTLETGGRSLPDCTLQT